MPSVTHDGRSFMLDGRRLWLASGSMSYSRVPREAWRDRVHAAKLAGLNCLDVPVFWNRHEPRPGKFDFKGENDLRHFIEIIGHAGLYAILRIGPFVGDGWDMGGLPAWLTENANARLRTGNNAYLEACSRFIGAVAEQVRDKQVTSPGGGGPILLLQCESEWTCGHAQHANEYLGELNRYFRESGLVVPVINANSLWQSVEGEIETWSGTEEMLAAMRQLSVVRPTQPRVVGAFALAPDSCWGEERAKTLGPWAIQRRLAEVLAGGGQFNIRPFVGGTNPGFSGGRLPISSHAFVTANADHGALVTEGGVTMPGYLAVRRLAHFASRFGRVLANVDPAYRPVAIDPCAAAAAAGAKKGKPSEPGHCSVVHAIGSQGSVAFVFSEEAGGDEPAPRTFPLLLPDGSTLPVTLAQQSVGWCLFGVSINGRATLDYCNVNAFASVGQVFVAFGPAGSRAMLSVNGSPIEVMVPAGAAPTVITHEGLTVVVVSEQAIDRTFVTDAGVTVGALGLKADGSPIAPPGEKSVTVVTPDGKVGRLPVEPGKPPATVERVSLGAWTCAPGAEHASGVSPRYAAINGPADLTSLGCPNGYGWYRISLKNSAPRKARVSLPQAADRLHLFLDGEEAGVVGVGPGAEEDATLTLKKGTQQLVVLAENLGRFAGGSHLGERKGLFGHLWELEALKVPRPKLVRSEPMDVLSMMSPLWEVREGDATLPDRLTWSLGKRKHPVVLRIDDFPSRAFLLVNGKLTAFVDRSGPRHVFIDVDALGKGNVEVQLAFVPDHGAPALSEELGDPVHFFEASECLSAKGEFAFAKWEPPADSHFQPVGKGAAVKGPCWWKCTFKVGAVHAPLFFEPTGMTKGQIYVNGVHISRYFVGTGAGKPVPPQSRYFIPDSRLHHGRENTIMIFDEHGASPSRARLVYDAEASQVRA